MSEAVVAAARALRKGELVAIPTETVYGLGADADNAHAVAQIYKVKGRPADHPLIVHVASLSHCAAWFDMSPNQPQDHQKRIERFQMLAHAFWPGPLTMIVPRLKNAPPFASANQTSIGLRVPSHELAQELLLEFHRLGGLGIAAPSANRFGKVSPTSAAHVRSDLGDDVQYILDGGDCKVGLESTIVDLTSSVPAVLRPGAITVLEVQQCLDEAVSSGPSTGSPQVSGSLASHYAPQTPLLLLSASELIEQALQKTKAGDTNFAVWALPETLAHLSMQIQKITAFPKADLYAVSLFATLRRLDELKVACVLIEKMPDQPQWAAVNDRMERASFHGSND